MDVRSLQAKEGETSGHGAAAETLLLQFYRFILKLSTGTVNQNSAEVNSQSCILHWYQGHRANSTHAQFHCENNLNFFLGQYPLFVLPLYSMGLQCPSHMG